MSDVPTGTVSGRLASISFVIDDRIFVGGGAHYKDLWEYDPEDSSWTQKASLAGSKRSEAVAFVYNNQAYVVTGFNNGSYLNDFWVYNAATNSWTEKRKISDATDEGFDDDYDDNIKRGNAVIFIMNNKAYLTAGSRSGLFEYYLGV